MKKIEVFRSPRPWKCDITGDEMPQWSTCISVVIGNEILNCNNKAMEQVWARIQLVTIDGLGLQVLGSAEAHYGITS